MVAPLAIGQRAAEPDAAVADFISASESRLSIRQNRYILPDRF